MGLSARRIVLEELGYKTSSCTSGIEALEMFDKQSFDLVVTDYNMPKMDGVVFIARLRAIRPDIPVILLSGFADTLGLNEKSTGADAVIQKSNNEVQHLIRTVGRLLARKTPRKPAKAVAAAAGAGIRRKTS